MPACPELLNTLTAGVKHLILYALLVFSRHALAHLSRIIVKDDSSDHITYFHLSVDQCLWFLHHRACNCILVFVMRSLYTATLLYYSSLCSFDWFLADSLVTSCTVLLSQLKNSWSSVFPYILHAWKSITLINVHIGTYCQTYLLSLFTFVNVLIEIQPVKWLKTEAPIMNPLSQSFRSFPLDILIQNLRPT